MGALRLDLTVRRRSFDVALALALERETVALVGPSGAGKSTVLRAVAGLVQARGRVTAAGETWLDSERGVDLAAERRSVGMVFQEYALFPHLSVRRNVEFGRRGQAGLLERFGLAALADAKPRELSGGERQRVALARALAPDPAVLLLDEPLAALDAHTRAEIRGELLLLLRDAERPTLVVSHDFEDAATLATRVGVLVEGRLRQLGSPAELVASPGDPFVASLTGAGSRPRDHHGADRARTADRRADPLDRSGGRRRGRDRLSVGGDAVTDRAGRLGAEPHRRNRGEPRPRREPRPRPRRAADGRDHRRLVRAPRPPCGRTCGCELQGDGDAATQPER